MSKCPMWAEASQGWGTVGQSQSHAVPFQLFATTTFVKRSSSGH